MALEQTHQMIMSSLGLRGWPWWSKMIKRHNREISQQPTMVSVACCESPLPEHKPQVPQATKNVAKELRTVDGLEQPICRCICQICKLAGCISKIPIWTKHPEASERLPRGIVVDHPLAVQQHLSAFQCCITDCLWWFIGKNAVVARNILAFFIGKRSRPVSVPSTIFNPWNLSLQDQATVCKRTAYSTSVWRACDTLCRQSEYFRKTQEGMMKRCFFWFVSCCGTLTSAWDVPLKYCPGISRNPKKTRWSRFDPGLINPDYQGITGSPRPQTSDAPVPQGSKWSNFAPRQSCKHTWHGKRKTSVQPGSLEGSMRPMRSYEILWDPMSLWRRTSSTSILPSLISSSEPCRKNICPARHVLCSSRFSLIHGSRSRTQVKNVTLVHLQSKLHHEMQGCWP